MESSKGFGQALLSVFGIVVCIFLFFYVFLYNNAATPAGYVGYITTSPFLSPARFVGLQSGPTSTGKKWRVNVLNISITPFSYSEDFKGDQTVLAHDNLQITFQAHLVWRVDPNQVKTLVEKYSTLGQEGDPIQVSYNNFLQQPFRTYVRDEVQKYDALKIKDNIDVIEGIVQNRLLVLTKDTPFEIISVNIGNIQPPASVADAISEKVASTQQLQTSIQQAKIRVVEAEGIAKAQHIINATLTPLYIQHEALQVQSDLGKNGAHTQIYIPVGANGVPLVFSAPPVNNNNTSEAGKTP